jgi:hypothetical protein
MLDCDQAYPLWGLQTSPLPPAPIERFPLHDSEDFFEWHRVAMWSVDLERVKNVRDCEDAHFQGELIRTQVGAGTPVSGDFSPQQEHRIGCPQRHRARPCWQSADQLESLVFVLVAD